MLFRCALKLNSYAGGVVLDRAGKSKLCGESVNEWTASDALDLSG